MPVISKAAEPIPATIENVVPSLMPTPNEFVEPSSIPSPINSPKSSTIIEIYDDAIEKKAPVEKKESLVDDSIQNLALGELKSIIADILERLKKLTTTVNWLKRQEAKRSKKSKPKS